MEEADKERYLKHGPLAVSGVLRELEKRQTPILVSCELGQFISRLLFVDQTQLIIDFGSNDEANQIALKAQALQLTAEAQGAKVEFTLGTLSAIHYEGLPAFASPLPESVCMIQRREHFRISVPPEPVFYCHGRWPKGTAVRFRLLDLSLGGMGVLVEGEIPEGIKPGAILKNIQLDIQQYGQFNVDAQLLHIGNHLSLCIDSKNKAVSMPRLSLCFVSLNAGQERQLQQVIFAIERMGRDKSDRYL